MDKILRILPEELKDWEGSRIMMIGKINNLADKSFHLKIND